MFSLLPFLALCFDAQASTVVLDGGRYFELRDPEPEKDDSKPPTPWAANRIVTVTPEEGGLRIHATWTIDAPAKGWLDDFVAGPSVRVDSLTVDGRPAAIGSGPSGTRLTAEVSGQATVVLDGFVDGDPAAGQSFALMPAVRGTIAAAGTKLELHVEDGARAAIASREGLLASARDLSVVLSDPAPLSDKPPLFVAEVAEGLTVRDGDVEGHAQVRWLVRQGELASAGGALPLVVRGAGRDVTVSGENVRSYSWSGDTLLIEPTRPVYDVFTVDLAWSVPVAAGDTATVAVPDIAPTGAFRVDASLLIARDDAIEVLPELPRFVPVPTSDLPSVTTGLITGTPTSAWRGQGGGTLSLMRVVPIEQPAVLVDVASLTIATNDEGRVMMRGYYTVRNERAAALRIVAPAGVAILGVQVSGKPVTPGKDDGEGWLIPLPRSLETVDGLLSFPIEVIAFGTTETWSKREQRAVPLLRVDAPVGVQRVTLHLPPGYALQNKTGEDSVVDDFTEGETLSYGLAVGDVAAAEVDARFQEALDAWMVNDFEVAQQKLDELKALGGESENVRKLQGNLDVVDVDEEIGVADAMEDTTVARRVKDMARARATEDVAKREELIVAAKEAERSGDYKTASESYSSAYAIGEKLSGLEQTESASFRGSNSSVQLELEEVAKKQADKEVASGKSKAKPDAKPTGKLVFKDEFVIEGEPEPRAYDFESVDIDGDLSGAYPSMPVTTPTTRSFHSTVDGPYRVPLVVLGDGDGVTDQTDALQAGANGIAVATPPADAGVDFLAADPSYVLGLLDNGSEEYGSIGVSGSGMGGGGVGYGYGYGSVGGVVGGSAGTVSYGDGVVEPMGSVRTTSNAVQRMPGSSRNGGGGRGGVGLRMAKRAPSAGPGEGYGRDGGPPEKPMEFSIGGDEPDEPVVTAQSLSLIVPDLGETVLFQSVLLPKDAAPAVLVKAKKTKKATNPSE